MVPRQGLSIAVALVVAACSKGATGKWQPFRGIEVHVADGTTAHERDGVLPGPGGLGGIPSGERPTIELSLAGPHGFFVEIAKPRADETVDAEIAALAANHVGSGFAPKKTGGGWELAYELSPPASGKAHVLYREIAGGHYECRWADVNCPDPAAAEAVCRSMRLEP